MFVPAPKTASRIPLAKSGMLLKHPHRTASLEHDLSHFDRISLRYISLKMHMTSSKAKSAKFKTTALKLSKSSSARVNVRLFKEAVKPALCHKHKSDPIVPRVVRRTTKNFKATAVCICHVFSSITS